MIRVLRLEESEEGRRIVFDTHPEMDLLPEEESPFVPGEELSEEEYFERLLALSEPVIKKAAAMLALRPLSLSMLLKKLREKGVPASRADFVADYFLKMGILDDEAYARLLAESLSERGKGPFVIKSELKRRGVSAEIAEEVLEYLPEAESAIEHFLRSRVRSIPIDEKEYRRLYSALLRRGFQSDDIRAALAPLRREEEDEL